MKVAIFYDNPALRDYWYALATAAEVSGQPVARTLLGEKIVIYRDPAGTVVSPHPTGARIARRPSLQGGWKKGVLACCYHGWSFGSSGKVCLHPVCRA